jgi:hypothetical protein
MLIRSVVCSSFGSHLKMWICNLKTLSLVLLVAAAFVQPVSAQELPDGNRGIAANYPGDRGIGDDPLVLFADDFESHKIKASLSRVWTTYYNKTRLAQENENAFLGNQSLEFSVPEDRGMASQSGELLKKECDTVFLRYYSKFDTTYDVKGSAHNGGGISARMYKKDGGNAVGRKSDGSNHFYVTLDHGRQKTFGTAPNPGYLRIYMYHPEQRSQWGDGLFPTGMVIPNAGRKFDFGDSFVSRPNVVTKLEFWHCHELMVKANTPGERDGRVAVWVDGKVAIYFPNLRLRDVESLKMDYVQIGMYIQKMKHPATKKWYDNVVAATSYIGPVTKLE